MKSPKIWKHRSGRRHPSAPLSISASSRGALCASTHTSLPSRKSCKILRPLQADSDPPHTPDQPDSKKINEITTSLSVHPCPSALTRTYLSIHRLSLIKCAKSKYAGCPQKPASPLPRVSLSYLKGKIVYTIMSPHLVDDSFVSLNAFYPLVLSTSTRWFTFFDGESRNLFCPGSIKEAFRKRSKGVLFSGKTEEGQGPGFALLRSRAPCEGVARLGCKRVGSSRTGSIE